MYIKPDFSKLIQYVQESIDRGKLDLAESIENHIDMLAQSALAQEEFEKKVAEYKVYWIEKNARKPFGWLPWNITLKLTPYFLLKIEKK